MLQTGPEQAGSMPSSSALPVHLCCAPTAEADQQGQCRQQEASCRRERHRQRQRQIPLHSTARSTLDPRISSPQIHLRSSAPAARAFQGAGKVAGQNSAGSRLADAVRGVLRKGCANKQP